MSDDSEKGYDALLWGLTAGELTQIRETAKTQTLREAEVAMVKAIGLLKRARNKLTAYTAVSDSEASMLYAEITDLLGD